MKMHILTAILIFLASPVFAGEAVTYTVDNQEYQGYYSEVSPEAPLVLILHDWDGLTEYEIKRAAMLNELGYNAFAADLFGAGVRPTKVEDKRQHTGELYKDREKMRRLIAAALEAAKAEGAAIDNTVVMGYCFGGAAVLEYARSGADLKGFVSFHGGLSTPEGQDYTNAKGSYLILHGTADTMITMDHFAALAVALEEAGLPHRMISYGGAPHAFTVFGSERYREEADQDSWEQFATFLEENLKS
jgi:dienelactone hydrolase